MNKIERIIILSDGIRGHFHQSLGIAKWLERLCGAEIKIIEVPKFSGFKRFLYLKIAARLLKLKNKKIALKWLNLTGFDLEVFKSNYVEGDKKILFISAGSSAAPFCLALANLYGAKSAVIMTPSVLGIKNFDFAIIPEHDKLSNNALITLGAPNHIYKPELKIQSEEFFKDINIREDDLSLPSPESGGKKVSPLGGDVSVADREGKKTIALLVGGSDANYDVNLNWAENVILNLLKAVEEVERVENENKNAALLITTSRRTGRAIDDKIFNIINNNSSVKYFLPASREPDINPVPAMLGAATHVIATEDSVSMVSEAVTAGFKVGLLRTDKKRGALIKIRNLTGGGTSRFDKLFDNMINKDMICDLGCRPDAKIFYDFINPDAQRTEFDFNEAERAAKWILERM